MKKTFVAVTLVSALLQGASASGEVVVRETETGIYVEIVGTPGGPVASASVAAGPAAADRSWEETLLRQREEARLAKKEARRLRKLQETEEEE